MTGSDRVDLAAMLRVLATRYAVETALIDSGGALTAALLSRALVDELSMIVAPALVGSEARPLFREMQAPSTLERVHLAPLEEGGGLFHVIYRVHR